MLIMLAVTEWSWANVLQLVSPDLSVKIFWVKVQYLGIVTLPPAMLIFALQYSGREKWLTRRNLALLAIAPSITILLVWTNEAHRLIWVKHWLDTSGPFSLEASVHGPGFWGWMAVGYLYFLTGTVLLVQSFIRSARLYRKQVLVLLIGLATPWLGNGLYLFGLSPWPHLDLTPIGFTVTGLALAWGLFRFRLSDIVPVARDSVFEGLNDDAVIVLDPDDRLVDLNPAAQSLVGRSASEVIGRPAAEVFADQPEMIGMIDRGLAASQTQAEVCLVRGEDRRHYELHLSPLKDRRSRRRGRLLVLRDISQRKRAEEERERLIARLQEALDKVKTLSGLLPICASCKKIRDDQGYWQQIEVYIRDRSEAEFSHSLCPECAKKLYPDHYKGD